MKILFALALLLGAAAVMWLWLRPGLQRSLTFFPTRENSAALERIAAAGGFERWTNAKGQPIGWQAKNGDPHRPLLILHGNAGYALHRLWLVELVREVSPTPLPKIYILEYPGYGDRVGSPGEAMFTRAACEALATLADRAVVLGESIGTGVAAQAAARCPDRIRSLILLTPFDSLTNVAAFHYPYLPVNWLMEDHFDSKAGLARFSKRVAVLVAEEDEVTPAPGGLLLYESIPSPKRLWKISGARHNDAAALLSRQQWREILEFAFGEDAQPPARTE